MLHWSDEYLNIPYSKLNCAELVEVIQREVFGRHYIFPQSENNIFSQSGAIKKELENFVHPKKTLHYTDGDLVLMGGVRSMAHVGVYFYFNKKSYVLHTLKKQGYAMRTEIRNLNGVGLFLEGIYKWQKLNTTKTL